MGRDHGSLSERMAEAARELQDHQRDPDATFDHAVRLACTNLDACDGASLSIVHRRQRIQTVGATSQMVVDADQLQYDVGEGPCLDSIWEEQTTYSPDLLHDERWPTWGPRVVDETDVRSILCFQLYTHGDTLGALNMYSTADDAFGDTARDEGLALAAHIAIAVAAAQQIDQLTQGLDTRTMIGQATGILMERFDLGGEAAFGVLARYSSESNVKLREVAAEVVRTRSLPKSSSDA